MKNATENSLSQSHASKRIDAFRKDIISMLSPQMQELYAHERLSKPLNEVLQKLDLQGHLDNHNSGLEALAGEATRQAMAASACMASVPSSRAAKALELMVEAWNQLHDICLLQSSQEDA